MKLLNLENQLTVQFRNPKLLTQALTHKSYAMEHGSEEHYEKLELLGDAILDFLVIEYLMQEYPSDSEGQLSKKRASLVNQTTLEGVAREFNLGPYIRLSRGEQKSGGIDKSSILSSVTESILGALYMDQGLESCRSLIKLWFAKKLKDAKQFQLDFKTELQEKVQGERKKTPFYELIEHRKLEDQAELFLVGVFIEKECLAQALGKTKKEAEQKAAQIALERFKS